MRPKFDAPVRFVKVTQAAGGLAGALSNQEFIFLPWDSKTAVVSSNDCGIASLTIKRVRSSLSRQQGGHKAHPGMSR
jgi:hypothetical protein